MTTLYISGPMTGIPGCNRPLFRRVATDLRRAGYAVLNPADIGLALTPADAADQPWEWWMRRALALLLDADGVALLPGWEHSRGAAIERGLAFQLGMPCHPWDQLLNRPDLARRTSDPEAP